MLVRIIARAAIGLALLLGLQYLVAPALPSAATDSASIGRDMDGHGDLIQAQETETKIATATCGATGNRYNDVRFTLSAPGRATVRFDLDGNWWMRQDPAGPMVAHVLAGEVVIPAGAPTGGGTLRQLSVDLPAGTFVLHCDCSGSSASRSAEAVLTVPAAPPPPTGQSYMVTARADAGSPAQGGWVHGYNDRIFLLTARQQVSFYPGTYSTPGASAEQPTGWIADSQGVTWWAIDRGTVIPRSTLDLPPGVYCLHTDYAKNMSTPFTDQWSLQFVGPSQPGGARTTVAAQHNPNATGSESKYQDASFILAQPQMVTISGDSNSATAWIVDSTGVMWYKVIKGTVQSCSAWVSPRGGQAPGVEGVLLAAGTYLLHADSSGIGSGRSSVTVSFVGTATSPFAWPSNMRCPCYRKGVQGEGECRWWDLRCQIEARLKRAIEREMERAIEQIEEQICTGVLMVPFCLTGLVLLVRPKRRA